MRLQWEVELVEGKDRLKELGPKDFDDQGKTVGLMLCQRIFGILAK